MYQNIDEDDEWQIPGTLGGIKYELNDYFPSEVIKEFDNLRSIRNQAMHGKKRYNENEALDVFRRVLKIIALTYNGNI